MEEHEAPVNMKHMKYQLMSMKHIRTSNEHEGHEGPAMSMKDIRTSNEPHEGHEAPDEHEVQEVPANEHEAHKDQL